MSYAKVLVLLLSFAVAANALATPHVVRHNAHHRAIAARVAAPEPLDMPLNKRQSNRRCKQRSSSASTLAVPTSSKVVQAPTSSKVVQAPTTTVIPTPETTKAAPTTTPKKETTTAAPAPPPTTTKAPATPVTTKAPAPPAAGNLPSFMVGTQTGQGTFYATGLGACGIVNKDTDHIAAVSHLLFDAFPGYNGANPNNNPMCGRSVTATYQGKSVVVKLTDRCEACKITDLDFSPSAFNTIADPSVGRISGMTWVWND